MSAGDRDYFTVEPTSLTIPRSGALAIFCGDKPKKHPDGGTSFSLRGPLLLMPQEMWDDPDETMAKVARVLNENAHLFFSSAKAPAKAAADVLAERDRQISAEGWTPEHDDEHDRGELSRASACYVMQSALDTIATPGLADATRHMVRELWPFARGWWKSSGSRRDLVKAAALILAEIERLDRAEARANAEATHA